MTDAATLPRPAPRGPLPRGRIPRFVAEAAAFLDAAGDPLASEHARLLRAALARPAARRFRRQPPAPLAATLALPGAVPLTASIAALAPALAWTEGSFTPPPGLAGRYAFAEIVGPHGNLDSRDISFGLFVQWPGTHYPPHWHEALEVYVVLSGHAGWQRGSAPFATLPPGTVITHARNEPHAMLTEGEPLLAMWGWSGDISDESYSFG